ncbi:MAG: tetratricopeptide repeat protein [Prolixibacteraceae bacterium]|nr:tetratricopeptide repeat protein [Prolixibacteraceae bacterium]
MKGHALNQFFYPLVLLFSVGCSTQNNTAISRFYHQLNSQYNVYFNARESVKEGLLRIDHQIIEDYTHLLPVYPETSPGASQVAMSQMEYAVQKCLKLIATHSITKSPKRKTNKSEAYTAFAYKAEYNKWVDDAYLLMGQAAYYQRDFHRAEESFNYILHNFSNQPTRNPSFLWLSRCYIETGEFDKAFQILKLLERDGSLPAEVKKDLTIVKADYYITVKDWKEAVFQLNQALKMDLSRKERGRYNFISAQLYLALGQNNDAVAAFHRVVKSRPPIRMAFEAKISLLEYDSSNPAEVDLALAKMIRNGNNRPYFDRIYYAKGEVALKSHRREEALKDFRTSVTYSIDNNNQRALSSLKVAGLSLEESNYRMASCYYDSAMAVIGPGYPGYLDIVSKTNGLAALVKDLELIGREDSLQKVALMSEKDRLSIINKQITKIDEEERKSQADLQKEQNSVNYFRGQQYRSNFDNQSNNSAWYFYNPVTAGLGKTDFQQIWGKRRLEDNWRRKNKISLNPGENDLADAAEMQLKEPQRPKGSNPKSVEYYLQDLPLTDSLMRASHDRIKSAYFAAGRIYESVLKDNAHAIAMYEELNIRYPASIYELPVWIEFHKMKYKEALYRNNITLKYPDSNYAKFLLNPDFLQVMEVRRQQRERKYGEALTLYKSGDYGGAGQLATEVMALQPDSLLLPKVKFIDMIARGKNASSDEFSKMLDQYLTNYPASPANPVVVKIRDLVRQNSLAELEKIISRMDSSSLSKLPEKTAIRKDDAFGGKYSYDEELFHYFLLSFPKGAKVDVNRLIFDLANFNIDYYTSIDFDVEEIKLNDELQHIVVRSLPNKEEAMGYFGTIIKHKEVFKTLEGVDFHYCLASSPNYRKIIEDQDLLQYLKFFVQNYSKISSPDK